MPEWPKQCRIHVGTDKETMWYIGEDLGLEGEALMRFRHVATEVELTLSVEGDGKATIVECERKVLAGELEHVLDARVNPEGTDDGIRIRLSAEHLREYQP